MRSPEFACAGKPTIYARFPNKQALFGAVMARMVQRNTNLENFRAARESGSTMEERLALVAAAVLRNALLPENVGLMRSVVASRDVSWTWRGPFIGWCASAGLRRSPKS